MFAVLTEDDLTLTPHPSPLTVFRLNGLQEKARTKEKAIGNGLKRTRDDLVDGHLSFRREAICLKPLCSVLNVWSNFPPSEVAGKSQSYRPGTHSGAMIVSIKTYFIPQSCSEERHATALLLEAVGNLTPHPHSSPLTLF